MLFGVPFKYSVDEKCPKGCPLNEQFTFHYCVIIIVPASFHFVVNVNARTTDLSHT